MEPPEAPPTQAPLQLFKYWAQMSPEGQRESRAARMGKKRHRTTTTSPTELQPPPSPQSTPVMAESCADRYVKSSTFSGWWQQTQNSQTPWPQGIQLHQWRMYSQVKLCVPEPLVQRVLWEFHNTSGHMGIHRMTNEVKHRYLMPPEQDIPTLIEGIRHACGTCQTTATPHHPRLGNLRHFPIPERAMHSVCLDIFAMPPTNWEDQEFDSILLCVDRHTAWIVACPTQTL